MCTRFLQELAAQRLVELRLLRTKPSSPLCSQRTALTVTHETISHTLACGKSAQQAPAWICVNTPTTNK